MTREETLSLIRSHLPELIERFCVRRLSLFGSVARDQASENSDVDLLVEFDGVATSRRFFGLKFFIEDLLERPVDLVTSKSLRPELRPTIEAELINV